MTHLWGSGGEQQQGVALGVESAVCSDTRPVGAAEQTWRAAGRHPQTQGPRGDPASHLQLAPCHRERPRAPPGCTGRLSVDSWFPMSKRLCVEDSELLAPDSWSWGVSSARLPCPF